MLILMFDWSNNSWNKICHKVGIIACIFGGRCNFFKIIFCGHSVEWATCALLSSLLRLQPLQPLTSPVSLHLRLTSELGLDSSGDWHWYSTMVCPSPSLLTFKNIVFKCKRKALVAYVFLLTLFLIIQVCDILVKHDFLKNRMIRSN